MASRDPFSDTCVISVPEYFEVSDRGRRIAAEAIRCSPMARKRVEERYGLDYCRTRYPEAYITK